MPGERMWAVAVSRNLVDKVTDLMAEFGRCIKTSTLNPHTNQGDGRGAFGSAPLSPLSAGFRWRLRCAAHRSSTG